MLNRSFLFSDIVIYLNRGEWYDKTREVKKK